jgi:hypothetical protein
VLSTDKIFLQLLSRNISVRDHFGQRDHDRAWMSDRFGVSPEQFVDFLALTGDSTNNISGVRGVGPKTAAGLVADFGTYLFTLNGWNYESKDTKTGVDTDALKGFAPILSKLMPLDPRGGYFRQRDMRGALAKCAMRDSCRQAFAAYCVSQGYASIEQGLVHLSLMFRVACAHTRDKQQQYKKLTDIDSPAAVRAHPEELRKVYELITQSPGPVVGHRLHPFPAFRGGESDLSSDDEAYIVSKSLDVSEFKAVISMSSGLEVYADRYRRGDNGLAVAVWDAYNEEWEMEVSANLITDDGAHLRRPTPIVQPKPKKPNTMKKPAAAKREDGS